MKDSMSPLLDKAAQENQPSSNSSKNFIKSNQAASGTGITNRNQSTQPTLENK